MAYDNRFSFETGNWGRDRGFDISKLLNEFLPTARTQAQFGASLEPTRQNAVMNAAKMFSPGNQQAQVDAFGRRATARAKDQARQMSFLNPGLQQGAQLDALNSAARSTNDFSAQINSPEGQMQALQGLLAALSEGQRSPALEQVLALFGPSTFNDQLAAGRPKQGNGLAGILGMIAGSGTKGGGTVLGDLLGGIF